MAAFQGISATTAGITRLYEPSERMANGVFAHRYVPPGWSAKTAQILTVSVAPPTRTRPYFTSRVKLTIPVAQIALAGSGTLMGLLEGNPVPDGAVFNGEIQRTLTVDIKITSSSASPDVERAACWAQVQNIIGTIPMIDVIQKAKAPF